MYIDRVIAGDIMAKLAVDNAKIIVIYGSRQVGKTTLVEHIIKQTGYKTLYINGDDINDARRLASRDTDKLSKLVKGYELLFIDEAQKIEDIGTNLKILYDRCKPLKIIVTGSSALELANHIKEPLTGRVHKYLLYPISFLELSNKYTPTELDRSLEECLIYGTYPDIFLQEGIEDKKEYLKTLAESYLYRDVLDLENIRYSRKIRDLLELLAFQIGSEISYSEIGQKLGLSHHTVIDYIDLLEKSFVIQTVRGFSRNLRKEITKKPKIYFYDLGIRNTLIGNFADINRRNDIGALWENFLFIERIKRNHYLKHICSTYFWRTYTGAELDYVEDYEGQLNGYEFKWSKTAKPPQLWLDEYNGSFKYVNKDNFLEFIL
jgi:predicted AAA+ superfamily ATPase